MPDIKSNIYIYFANTQLIHYSYTYNQKQWKEDS